MFVFRSSEIICSYSFDQEVIFTLREWGKQMKAMYIVGLKIDLRQSQVETGRHI